MKTLTAILVSSVFASAAASAQTTNTPTPTAGVQAFLNVLNSGKGKPMEQMTPQEARQVLIGAQQGAKLPPAQVSEKTIQVNGQAIKLKIVKPENASGTLPPLCSFTAAAGCWVTSLPTNA
jgi:hypothetical protein